MSKQEMASEEHLANIERLHELIGMHNARMKSDALSLVERGSAAVAEDSAMRLLVELTPGLIVDIRRLRAANRALAVAAKGVLVPAVRNGVCASVRTADLAALNDALRENEQL